MRSVSRRQVGDGPAPIDSDRRILGMHAHLRIRGIGGSVQIEHLATTGQRLESMREAFRNEQRFAAFTIKHHAVPMQERARTLAQIDRHVEDLSLHTGDQLRVRMRADLQMHAPHRAQIPCERPIDLPDHALPKDAGKIRLIVEAFKIASGIGARKPSQLQQSRQRSRFNDKPIHER